jgi:23S rRNA pseudouridine1911/1915/1917 synthase
LPRVAGTVVLDFPVSRQMAGTRLDRFIQHCIPRLSRSRAQEIIKACAYRADGKRRRPSDIVRAGEVVLLVRERFEEPVVPLDYEVLLDDGAVLAIAKPAGLPMHPTATYHRHTLSYLLREHYGDADFAPAIAHRLDRETSGVVLCGRTPEAERTLKMTFERHEVDKRYLAIVRGELADDEGRIDLPLAPVTEGLHVMMETRPDGAEASTHYRVVERRGGHTLVGLEPGTGRQHQLRVHLAEIGHPIVGDKLYGPEGELPFMEYIETGMTPDLLGRLGMARQALHAHRVELTHPSTGEPFVVEAPMPADMQAYWDAL